MTKPKTAEPAPRPSRGELEQQVAELTKQNAMLQHRLAGRETAADGMDGLLQAMLDSIPDRIYFKDTQSRFLQCSQAVARRLGLESPAQVIGKTDFDFLPADRAEEFYKNEQRILQTGEPLINKTQKQTKPDGEVVWASVTKAPLRDQRGRIIGLVGINRDITEHKRTEEALRQSRDELEQRVGERTAELSEKNAELARTNETLAIASGQLQALLDNIPDRIYFKDAQSRFLKCSLALAKRLGLVDPERIVGQTDFDFHPPDRAREFFENEQRIIQTGEPLVNKTEKQTDPSGKIIWASVTKVPLRDKAGKVVGLVGINRDITALKEAEDILDRERRLLRTLIDNLPDCIYAKDLTGRKTLANLADLKNLRCKTEAEAVGKNDFHFFPPELAEKFWADDQKVIHGQPVINREEFFFDETGQKRWLLTSKLPLRDQSGATVGLVGIARDITVIKQAEEKLAEHMRELEQRDHQTVEEMNMARELQLAMLPQEFPCLPRHKPAAESHLEFSSFFAPAGAVSGDFFDVVPLSDTAVGLFICDAMGHDVRAALVTAMMRALVADLSGTVDEPGELLAQMNRELSGIFKQSGSIMYATAFYLIVDLARAEFRYASAAHPDPILLRRESNTVEWLKADPGGKKGPALGLFADGQFPTYRRPMVPGDLIALFTDGLIEVEGPNNEIYSAEHLLASVRRHAHLPANELFAGLIEEIKQFSGRAKFDDDICIASVEVKRLEPQPSGSQANPR